MGRILAWHPPAGRIIGIAEGTVELERTAAALESWSRPAGPA